MRSKRYQMWESQSSEAIAIELREGEFPTLVESIS